MPIEIPGSKFDIKQHLGKSLLGTAGKYLKTDQTVSEVQMEAFRQTLRSLPEGKIKDFISKMEGLQEAGAKTNEVYLNIQDQAWRLAKPLIVAGFPLAALIPDKPLSKITIKATKLGSNFAKRAIDVSTKGLVNLKHRVEKKKNKV